MEYQLDNKTFSVEVYLDMEMGKEQQ